jgi:CheY-like chemotaxis protein
MMMPELGGPDIARLIEADAELRGTPIIFLTATVLKDEIDAHDGMIDGRRCIAKPAETKDLIGAIRAALSNNVGCTERSRR